MYMKTILVTGGTGYIGSHTLVELLNSDYEVIVVDNFSNSSPKVLNRIGEITGKRPTFYEVDLLDIEKLEKVFIEYDFQAVIHFAGHKAVGESVEEPLKYYTNNVSGTLNLCNLMAKYRVKKMVFSSSATVYGLNNESPMGEGMLLNPTNPYGRTKMMIENILSDLFASDSEWSIAALRYFNPVGAHDSGLIGESPNGIPNNLIPYITQVAEGKRPFLSVYGNDYDTLDGTGVRDYIHVMDLAEGHLKALAYVDIHKGIEAINLGTGKGYSVLEVIKQFEMVADLQLPYKIVERRLGDIGTCFADVTKAKVLLGWTAKRGLEEMCRDSWGWQKKNLPKYDA